MEQEEWRPVAGLEGKYSISNMGRVKSHERKCANGMVEEHVLKQYRPRVGSSMYVSVEGETKNRRVDKLVLESFIGDGEYPCHLDGDLSNNRLDNLRWGTRREAHDYIRKSGRGANGKLTPDDIVKIRELHSEGDSVRSISILMGVSRATINKIVRGITWTMV